MDGKAAAEDDAQEAARRSPTDGGDEDQARAEVVGDGSAKTRNKEFRHGHATGSRSPPRRRSPRRRSKRTSSRRLLKQKFQTAHGTRGDRGRERGPDAGHAGARRLEPRQERGARHDRGDDRAARREAFGADERSAARARVPAAGKRLARAELSRVQLRDRRDAQDPRDERRKDGALPQPQEQLSRRALGPEPAVQGRLRERVRHARRRALWGAGRGLLPSVTMRWTCSCCAISRRSPPPRSRRSSPAPIPICLAWIPGGS